MNDKTEELEEISIEEALQMEVVVSQALIDILVAKGIITESELTDRIEEIKLEQGIEF